MKNAKFIEVSAEVRYWEDAYVNGQEDKDGSLIPCRNGDIWEPIIALQDGQIQDWPRGAKADVHYKVCDQGEYWLLDADRNRIAKWKGHYVPDEYLCHGDDGYGDYIIFEVDQSGQIEKWEKPVISAVDWQAVDA
jgi:hypothetical protein